MSDNKELFDMVAGSGEDSGEGTQFAKYIDNNPDDFPKEDTVKLQNEAVDLAKQKLEVSIQEIITSTYDDFILSNDVSSKDLLGLLDQTKTNFIDTYFNHLDEFCNDFKASYQEGTPVTSTEQLMSIYKEVLDSIEPQLSPSFAENKMEIDEIEQAKKAKEEEDLAFERAKEAERAEKKAKLEEEKLLAAKKAEEEEEARRLLAEKEAEERRLKEEKLLAEEEEERKLAEKAEAERIKAEKAEEERIKKEKIERERASLAERKRLEREEAKRIKEEERARKAEEEKKAQIERERRQAVRNDYSTDDVKLIVTIIRNYNDKNDNEKASIQNYFSESDEFIITKEIANVDKLTLDAIIELNSILKLDLADRAFRLMELDDSLLVSIDSNLTLFTNEHENESELAPETKIKFCRNMEMTISSLSDEEIHNLIELESLLSIPYNFK